jgi:hypothetical protein
MSGDLVDHVTSASTSSSGSLSSQPNAPPQEGGTHEETLNLQLSMGMGSERSMALSPSPSSESRKFPRNNNTLQHIANASDHTEIEYYSTDASGDADEQDASSAISSSDVFGGRRSDETRSQYQQRSATRQSDQSSDEFSLPIGAQDDVSSLEPDLGGLDTNDLDSVEAISLEVEHEHGLERKPAVSPMASISRSIQASKSQVVVNNTNLALPVLPSFPSNRIGQPEPVQEDKSEERERTVMFNDSLRGVNDEEMDTMIHHMHKSLFWPLSGRFRVGTSPRQRFAPAMDDFTLDELAKNMPPELDLHEARKYIIQLAGGMRETLGNPLLSPVGVLHSSAVTFGSLSEYTEIVIDDDEVEELKRDGRWPRTPQNSRRDGVRLRGNDSRSNDFTERVEGTLDDDEFIEEIIEEEVASDT